MPAELRTLVDSVIESSDSQTLIIKLPKSGALHTLNLRMRMTNGSTSALNVNIFDVVDLIEVVGNGSQVLYSLIPRVIEKRHEIRRGRGINMVENNRASAVQEGTFQIEFGRWDYDPEMFLPLNFWNDLELRITYSPAISATVGFATGTFTVDLNAVISPVIPPSYLGTLVTRNVQNVLSAVSGNEIVEHHLGRVYRDICVYAYETAIADGVDVTDVEVRLNDGVRSIYRQNWNELLDWNGSHFNMDIQHENLGFLNDDDVYACRISLPNLLAVGGEHDADVSADTFDLVSVDAIAGDRLTFNLSVADVTAGAETHATQTALTNVRIITGKKIPSYAVLLPFDFVDDPGQWLSSSELSRLQTFVTQGAAGADLRISTTEVERFV